MKERFVEQRFTRSSLETIAQAESILEEYRHKGFTMTLRQLYYQFVGRGIFEENSQKQYKRLGDILNNARLAGLIDWSTMIDRTRHLRAFGGSESPDLEISGAASGYARNIWENQPIRPEVWIEKDALIGVVQRACERLWVPYYACRGYSSQSEQYSAGKRLKGYIRDGLHPIVIHLGDHDPSGIDMTRDNQERLSMFARQGIEVRRIALNMDQVEQYDPPPNPAKETDSRCGPYVEAYGESSWELDALSPEVIDELITAELEPLVDPDLLSVVREREAREQQTIQAFADNFDDIEAWLRDNGRL